MTPARPLFIDGAILGAGDLTALEQLDRDRDARATRHLHTPGVGAGLELQKVTPPGQTGFVEVTLQPGYAIDGTGRELVVPTALPVSADQFKGDVPNPVTQKDSAITVWYPVFIRGLDAPVVATNGKTGCEGGGGPTRIAEDVEVEFGRPGDATAEQTAPPPDAGPGAGTWRVLVGFVQLDTATDRFVDAGTSADGVVVPTAGVRAGLVAGQTGRVEIRPQPTAASRVPAVLLDADQGGSLLFGLHTGTGTGTVDPLMKVDSSGNLTVKGTLAGTQTAGTVRVASGTASDGVVLPLPAGTDQQAVDDGTLEVSILLTPRYPDPPQSGDRFIPAECRVDSDRRVHCWGTRFVPGGAWQDEVPLSCDYLVLVSVAQGGP
jgi:hypothetical protein